MKNARSFFSDATLKQYKEDILPAVKVHQYQGSDFDYIYQVLMEANQFKTTHNFHRTKPSLPVQGLVTSDSQSEFQTTEKL